MDELTFPRPADLTDDEWTALSAELEPYADLRYRQIVAARAFAPHVVKHNVVNDATGPRDTVFDCPDCTRGLVADGDVLVCSAQRPHGIPDALRRKATHHDIIACGRTFDG